MIFFPRCRPDPVYTVQYSRLHSRLVALYMYNSVGCMNSFCSSPNLYIVKFTILREFHSFGFMVIAHSDIPLIPDETKMLSSVLGYSWYTHYYITQFVIHTRLRAECAPSQIFLPTTRVGLGYTFAHSAIIM